MVLTSLASSELCFIASDTFLQACSTVEWSRPPKASPMSMSDACVEFVDGGIMGGPAWKPDATRLYLSGRTAGRVAECFAGGPLAVEVIGAEI